MLPPGRGSGLKHHRSSPLFSIYSHATRLEKAKDVLSHLNCKGGRFLCWQVCQFDDLCPLFSKLPLGSAVGLIQ